MTLSTSLTSQQQHQHTLLPALPPPQHPLLIPELRDQITEGLTVQDYACCLLVNRLWNKVFTPYLYHTIVLRQGSLESVAAAGSTDSGVVTSTVSPFQHYGHWVRQLDLRMDNPDGMLDNIRKWCPWMETVKLNFGRLLEEQFEMFILGIQPPVLLSRFGGIRDPTQATTLKRWMTASPTTTTMTSSNSKTGATLMPQQQERRRRSVGTELSAAVTVLEDKERDRLMLGTTKARKNSMIAFPTLVPLSCAPLYERPAIVPTISIIPPITDSDTETNTTTDTTTTAVIDPSHWRIPSDHNGFLSNTLKNLQLQVPGDCLFAVLLWLTRAGLDGRLQGLRSFRLSGQETSAVFGVSSSAIHDFLAAYPGLEQLTLLSIQVEPAPSETPWDSLEGSEGSEMLQPMVDSGSSPTPTTMDATGVNEETIRHRETENDVDPEAEDGAEAMAAITAALAGAFAGSSAQSAVYKGIHYKTHNSDYFADLIATSQSTLEELKLSDPLASRSKVTDLHIFQDGQLGPLLSRLPHLLRLTTEFFERSRISPDLLLPIQTSCRSLVSFTYLGKPSCPFADRFPRNNLSSAEPFFLHWETFFQELVHLKELILLNGNLLDQDFRTLVRYGHDRIRILRVKGGTRSTWHGARMVLENCSKLEECTLTCYGPIDELFATTGHPVELFYPPSAADDDEVEAIEDQGQHHLHQDQHSLQITPAEPREWLSKDTLRSLCLSGLVLYNDEVNRKLFTRLKTLHRLRELTVQGRGMTLEGLLGDSLRVLALEDQRLELEEHDSLRREEQQRMVSAGGEEGVSASALGLNVNNSTTISTFANGVCTSKRRRSRLYPKLETLDLPRLDQKLSSQDLIQLLQELPRLRWMDCGGAYELETLMWLDTHRRDLLKTFSR
ncbi:hypothetical protein BGX29_004849 [Mortierella sp. GBA35]|nr:hypothetical protein BGX29_004849 [Mortierella sp. GBA35]